jgi:hypothetical protein
MQDSFIQARFLRFSKNPAREKEPNRQTSAGECTYCTYSTVFQWQPPRQPAQSHTGVKLLTAHFVREIFLTSCLAFHKADCKNFKTSSRRHVPCLQDDEAIFCVRSPGKAKQLVKKFGHRQKHLFSASGLAALQRPHVEIWYKSTQN